MKLVQRGRSHEVYTCPDIVRATAENELAKTMPNLIVEINDDAFTTRHQIARVDECETVSNLECEFIGHAIQEVEVIQRRRRAIGRCWCGKGRC